MKQTVNNSQFHDAFHSMGRGNQFSYDGLERIYEYLEQLDEDYELDVIALCCDFVEMTMNEVIDAYSVDIDYDGDVYQQVTDYISNHSTLIGDTADGNFVFAQF